MTNFRIKHLLAAAALTTLTSMANATIVQIQTNFGDIEVNLFDETTPKTVENFLSYINEDAYDDTLVHRSDPGFIIQSGGFYINLDDVAKKPAVINEPKYSNLRGTISMAKIGGQPHSATSQWFINLANNKAILDAQNGGFTVFGQVTDAGMEVMDTIAELDIQNLGGAFTEIPLQGSNKTSITTSNAVIVNSIEITDHTIDSASDLEPVENTSLVYTGSDSDSGGGSLGFPLLLILLGGLGLSIYRKTQ